MTWTLTTPYVPKAQFDEAVDAAQATGQEGPGVNEDVLLAKALLKAAAGRVKRPNVGGRATGHALQPGNNENTWDGFTISVWGEDDSR